jgi:hypothetical protein
VELYMNFSPQADRFHVQRQANGNGLPSTANSGTTLTSSIPNTSTVALG